MNDKVTNFRKYGLSKQAKFLYVFTTENFDITTRPVEYSECRPMIERVEKEFVQLLRMGQKLPEYRYRFALLHQFKEFQRAVWVMPGRYKSENNNLKSSSAATISRPLERLVLHYPFFSVAFYEKTHGCLLLYTLYFVAFHCTS